MIVQTECRTTSLLDCYAEVKPILCKDTCFSPFCKFFMSVFCSVVKL